MNISHEKKLSAGISTNCGSQNNLIFSFPHLAFSTVSTVLPFLYFQRLFSLKNQRELFNLHWLTPLLISACPISFFNQCLSYQLAIEISKYNISWHYTVHISAATYFVVTCTVRSVVIVNWVSKPACGKIQMIAFKNSVIENTEGLFWR